MSKEPGFQRPLIVLHVEDDPADAELIEKMLVADGLSVEIIRVETRDVFLDGLKCRPLDLILCDYTLPQFHGLTALELARERRPDVPFIFVSGTLGDDLAADTLRRGATDYLLKDRLARLVPAVRRVLKEAAIKSLLSELPPTGQGSDPNDDATGRGKES
jgi:two-component system, cell cycle sensor histidine kinase and response regulator CckA